MVNPEAGPVLLLVAVVVLYLIPIRRGLQHIGRFVENALLQATYNLLFGRKRKNQDKRGA